MANISGDGLKLENPVYMCDTDTNLFNTRLYAKKKKKIET